MAKGIKLAQTFGNRAKPDQLVVVFHGLKTDGDAMLPAISLAIPGMDSSSPFSSSTTDKDFLERTRPNPPLVLVPEGPYKMAVRKQDIPIIRKHHPSFTPDKSRAWFRIKGNNLMKMLTLKLSVRKMNKFIDAQLKKYGLTDDQLVLMGYSQGGMMALYTGLSRNKPCKAIISHSGFYLGDFHGSFPVKSHPPVLALMGEDDRLFNAPGSHFPQHKDTVAKLRKAGVTVTSVLVPNLDHDYDYKSMAVVQEFLLQGTHHAKSHNPKLYRPGEDYTLPLTDKMFVKKPEAVEGAVLEYEYQNGQKRFVPVDMKSSLPPHKNARTPKRITLYIPNLKPRPS